MIYLSCMNINEISDRPEMAADEISCVFGEEYYFGICDRRGRVKLSSLAGAWLLLSLFRFERIAAGKLTRSETGKPRLADESRNVEFSIAHSGDIAVCALSDGDGSVGVDIERIALPDDPKAAKKRDRLSSRWLEGRGIFQDSTPEGFLSAWTTLESAAKYTGEGISGLKALPGGTEYDRFILRRADALYIVTLCRKTGTRITLSPEMGAMGFERHSSDQADTVEAAETVGTYISVLGIGFDAVTLEEAVERAAYRLENKKEGDSPMTVFTPNPVISMLCRKDGELRKIINSSTMSLADGNGVVAASKRQQTPLPSRVAGIDFGYELMRRATELNKTVFLLGGKPMTAEMAAERLMREIPGLQIVGTRNGYEETDADGELSEYLRSCRPDLLIVCLGSPKQERWVWSHSVDLRASGVAVAAALGGALDVWSGRVRRAPRIFIGLKLEWLWRIFIAPSKIKLIPTLIGYRIATRKKFFRRKSRSDSR